MDYKLTESKLLDHKIGAIIIESWEHRDIDKSTESSISIFKADPDRPESYGTKLFEGSLVELISKLQQPIVNAPYLPKDDSAKEVK